MQKDRLAVVRLRSQQQLGLPVLWQRSQSGHSFKQLLIRARSKVEPRDVSNAHAIGVAAQDFNLRARSDAARLDDRKIEATPSARQEFLDDVISSESEGQFVTGHTRLGNRENC